MYICLTGEPEVELHLLPMQRNSPSVRIDPETSTNSSQHATQMKSKAEHPITVLSLVSPSAPPFISRCSALQGSKRQRWPSSDNQMRTSWLPNDFVTLHNSSLEATIIREASKWFTSEHRPKYALGALRISNNLTLAATSQMQVFR